MSYFLNNVVYLIIAGSLLGAFIGFFGRKIFTNKYYVKLEEELRQDVERRLKGRDRYISQLKYELNDAEEGLALQSKALQKSLQNKAEGSKEQQDKMEQYQIRMRSAENKLISLKRTFIVYKAQKQKELDKLQHDLEYQEPILKEKLHDEIAAQSPKEVELDMDATLELDESMQVEENPFVLRNALVNEKRKVEQISMVQKELNETYLRFAKEKQDWMRDKVTMKDQIATLEKSVNRMQP